LSTMPLTLTSLPSLEPATATLASRFHAENGSAPTYYGARPRGAIIVHYGGVPAKPRSGVPPGGECPLRRLPFGARCRAVLLAPKVV